MKNATILFIGGIHGKETGELGPDAEVQDLKNQFSDRILSNSTSRAEWLIEDRKNEALNSHFLMCLNFSKIRKREKLTRKKSKMKFDASILS